MKTEFRNRAFLPVVMPLAILVALGAVVGLVALILLYVDRQGAIALALLGAAGVLVAISLATSKEQLDRPRKTVILLAGTAPMVVGGLVAAGLVGGLSDEDRNINVEPHQAQWIFEGVQEDAPVLAAVDSTSFCQPEGGDCQPTREWSFTYTAEQIEYAFNNQDTTAEHNLQIFNVPADQLEGIEDPLALTDLQANYELITPGEPPTFQGPEAQTYQWTPLAVAEDGASDDVAAVPGQAYFVCTIHAGAMWGVVEISPEDV